MTRLRTGLRRGVGKLFTFLFTAVCVIGCTDGHFHITWKPKARASHGKPSARVVPPSHPGVISGDETGTLVSGEWIEKYRRYEEKFGTVKEDKDIYNEGEQYRIPSKVADHFSDMVRADSAPSR
jgi:hypothetical protein